jgi:MFS family permease
MLDILLLPIFWDKSVQGNFFVTQKRSNFAFWPRIIWGWLSDRIGRKPFILMGVLSSFCSILVLGFSVNYPMAIAARGFGGLFDGKLLI